MELCLRDRGGGIPPSHMGFTGLLHPCGGLPGHSCDSGSLRVGRSLHIFAQVTRDSYGGSSLVKGRLPQRGNPPPPPPTDTISLAVFNGVEGEGGHPVMAWKPVAEEVGRTLGLV